MSPTCPCAIPALLAKSAASLDRLSDGRVELGLGAGAFWEGIARLGRPVSQREESVDALVEAIAMIRRLWAGDTAGRWRASTTGRAAPTPGPNRPTNRDLARRLRPADDARRRTARRRRVPEPARLPLDGGAGAPRRDRQGGPRCRARPGRIRRVANLNGVIADGTVRGLATRPGRALGRRARQARPRPALRRLRRVVRPRGPARADRAVRDRGRARRA